VHIARLLLLIMLVLVHASSTRGNLFQQAKRCTKPILEKLKGFLPFAILNDRA